jgi:hypothetical protein
MSVTVAPDRPYRPWSATLIWWIALGASATPSGVLLGKTPRSSDRRCVISKTKASHALERGDPADLLRSLHPELRWTSFRGDTFDRDAYAYSNTTGTLRWRSQTIEPEHVVVDGDTAVVQGLVTDEVERDGGHSETYRLRITMTWVRRNGEWLCLAGRAGPTGGITA